jgi:uncharacterized membrane protein
MIKQFFFTAIPLALFDALWFFTMKPFYVKYIGNLLRSAASFPPVIAFYIMYAIGIMLLVTLPAIAHDYSLGKIFLYGLVLGFVVYGTYNLTNQGLLKDWSPTVMIVDTLWGTVMTGVVSVISVWLMNVL